MSRQRLKSLKIAEKMDRDRVCAIQQKRWITNSTGTQLNKEFDKLKIGDEDRSILKYKTKLDISKLTQKLQKGPEWTW